MPQDRTYMYNSRIITFERAVDVWGKNNAFRQDLHV